MVSKTLHWLIRTWEIQSMFFVDNPRTKGNTMTAVRKVSEAIKCGTQLQSGLRPDSMNATVTALALPKEGV